MIDETLRMNIIAHIEDVAEAEGKPLDAEIFFQLLWQEWDVIMDAAQVDKKSDRRRLKQLQADKANIDQAALDVQAEIDALEAKTREAKAARLERR